MRKARMIWAAALAVFAFSAVASASASASQWEIEGIGAITANESITGAQNGSQVLEVKAIGLKITCTKLAVTGTIELAGASKATLTYTKCATAPAPCKATEPITAEVKDQLEGTPVKDKFSENGKPFTEITIAGCGLAGKYKVEGTQVCSLPGAGAFAIKQELVCATTGSALKVLGLAATYEGKAKLELSGAHKGKKWKAS